MISERELLEAIKECQTPPKSYDKCKKLATYFVLLNNLYPVEKDYKQAVQAQKLGYFDPLSISDSEFMQAVADKDWSEWLVILDELMDTIHIVEPRLYNAVMRKLRE